MEFEEIIKLWQNLADKKKGLFGGLVAKKSKFFNKSISWPLESIKHTELELLRRIDNEIHTDEEVINRRNKLGFTIKKAA